MESSQLSNHSLISQFEIRKGNFAIFSVTIFIIRPIRNSLQSHRPSITHIRVKIKFQFRSSSSLVAHISAIQKTFFFLFCRITHELRFIVIGNFTTENGPWLKTDRYTNTLVSQKACRSTYFNYSEL